MPPREVIDVDEWDIFCTGVRHCIRIDRSPSPRPKKRPRNQVTISLNNDNSPVALELESHSQFSPRPPSMDHHTELQRITQSELASRTACLDSRPTKKRATNALKMAVNAVDNHNELKRRECQEVIEISSDSEPENWPFKVCHATCPCRQPYAIYSRGKKWMNMLVHYMTRTADLATPETC
ncbi:hypothetical protein L210DRAFT_613108 [Boletus edulis BED1]|uniref:Uncharacterized protein n=1 Tax=Boletus edulis BED1 TaxID=1328754 RepID=A0AAD4GK42_BOLED|nr:hypothetical protein L210DRAFT_613108 [Boletus edulis BED1]